MTTIAQLEVEQAIGKDMAAALFDIVREWDEERHLVLIPSSVARYVMPVREWDDDARGRRTAYSLYLDGVRWYREIQTTWLSDRIPRDEDAIAWLMLAVWLAPSARLQEWFALGNSCVTIHLDRVLGLGPLIAPAGEPPF